MSAKPTTTKPELVDPAVDPVASSAAAPDPFDLASLRLNPSFLETAGVKKLVTTMPVKRPSPQDFFRVHPASEYRDNFAIIDLKDDREEFIAHPSILPELTGEFVLKTVFAAVNRQGVVFLWPIRLPVSDERKTEWPRSAREAAELAMTRWVRVKANMSLGAYEIFEAPGVVAEPVWPQLPYADLCTLDFGGASSPRSTIR